MLENRRVEVDDPIYHSSFTEKYIDYRVSYHDGTKVWRTRRRFSDFVELWESLSRHDPVLLLPHLPTYHIYTLWDRCSPKLIKERRVRLRLCLEHLLSAFPELPILNNFLKQDRFHVPPITGRLANINDQMNQDDACELNRRIQGQLKTIETFSDRLLHLRRSIKIYGVFWDASLSCRQGLVDAMRLFAEARSVSTHASSFNGISSKISRERILMGGEDASIFSDADQYLVDHYIGLIESLFDLNSSCEEARKAWLSAKDREIDAITEVRMSLFIDTKEFDMTYSKQLSCERAKKIADEKLLNYASFLRAINNSIAHLEKQYIGDIAMLISRSTKKFRSSLKESIQIWHENSHALNLTDNLHW